MVLILVFSLPITAIQGLNAWQKYKKHKAVEKAMKNIELKIDTDLNKEMGVNNEGVNQ
jgi:hypothetical protein